MSPMLRKLEGKKMNILIVEDAEIAGAHLQTMLSAVPGISVIHHPSDEPGVIEHINALLPDAAILNITDVVILNISRQTGAAIAVLKSIKECNVAIKVMVLVSYTDKLYIDRCMRAGADYFFDKAFFDGSFKFIRVRAAMRIRAALWQLAHPCVQNDRFVQNDRLVALH